MKVTNLRLLLNLTRVGSCPTTFTPSRTSAALYAIVLRICVVVPTVSVKFVAIVLAQLVNGMMLLLMSGTPCQALRHLSVLTTEPKPVFQYTWPLNADKRWLYAIERRRENKY
jgi:hypothetical protein